MDSTTQLSVDAFKRLVREGVNDTAKAQGWNEAKDNERGYAFQKWTGELLIRREGLDANIDDGMFLSGDLMIDLALEDADRKLLYLIQTKYPSLAQSPPIPEEDVISFLDRHSVLYDHPDWVRAHANDQLFEYVGDYAQKLKDGWGIYFYFVSTGRASPKNVELVNEKHAHVRRSFPNVNFQLLDLTGLKELYIQAQTLEQSIPEETRFFLRKNSWISKSDPHEALLTIVRGNTLAALYKKERERIFAYNIRSYLGRNQLNKDIIETAMKRPDEFYYFNNGVSAICTSFEINEKTNEFVAENFQIINGAQTVGALSTVPQLSADVEVLLRVTKAGSVKTEKGFNADIIRYNNTQNVVKLSDFRSNDQFIYGWKRNWQNSGLGVHRIKDLHTNGKDRSSDIPARMSLLWKRLRSCALHFSSNLRDALEIPNPYGRIPRTVACMSKRLALMARYRHFGRKTCTKSCCSF